MDHDLMAIPGVATRLATSKHHIRRLVFERRIPYRKVAGLLRFDPRDINEWLDTSRVEAVRTSYHRR